MMFWGLSEALDLFDEYISDNQKKSGVQHGSPPKCEERIELNVLVFGANDPRHVIKTMAKLYTHKAKGVRPIIHFYLIEGCIEIVARNIMLLAIALENDKSLSLHNKVHIFMDVYGNSLLRPSSHQYLLGKTKTLLKIITDDARRKELVPFLNINPLKYKERDGLENAFNFWLPKEERGFPIQQFWSDRVRKLLGIRYDYRDGAFDWDLNMILKERKGQQICSQEYRHWRDTGIAFTYPEYEYSKPNRTLAAGLTRNGDQFYHRGYAGDIQSGPFSAFGLSSDEEGLLKSSHGENEFRSTDVTAYNLHEIFHELATKTPYKYDINIMRKYGTIRFIKSKPLEHDECEIKAVVDYEHPWLFVEDVDIHLMTTEEILGLQDEKNRWHNFFDVAFVGHNYFSLLKKGFVNFLKKKALLLLETKLMTTCRSYDVKSFKERLLNYAETMGLDSAVNYNAVNGQYSVLKFRKNSMH